MEELFVPKVAAGEGPRPFEGNIPRDRKGRAGQGLEGLLEFLRLFSVRGGSIIRFRRPERFKRMGEAFRKFERPQCRRIHRARGFSGEFILALERNGGRDAEFARAGLPVLNRKEIKRAHEARRPGELYFMTAEVDGFRRCGEKGLFLFVLGPRFCVHQLLSSFQGNEFLLSPANYADY